MLRLIGVSAYAACVIRGGGAPVCFLTNGVQPNLKFIGGNSNTPLSSNNSNILSSSGAGYYRDFTPTKLDTNSRNAKSKYDTQTYRRWKRAKKKAK